MSSTYRLQLAASARNEAQKVPPYGLFYFPQDETLEPVPTSKVKCQEDSIVIETGKMVRIKWGTKTVPAKVIGLGESKTDMENLRLKTIAKGPLRLSEDDQQFVLDCTKPAKPKGGKQGVGPVVTSNPASPVSPSSPQLPQYGVLSNKPSPTYQQSFTYSADSAPPGANATANVLIITNSLTSNNSNSSTSQPLPHVASTNNNAIINVNEDSFELLSTDSEPDAVVLDFLKEITTPSEIISSNCASNVREWNQQFQAKEIPPTVEMKSDMKKARMLNVLTKSNPTQNIRDLYRYKCGYGPCVIFQKDALLDDGNDVPRHFPDFNKLMEDLTVRRGEGQSSVEANRRVAGDIVIVNPGVNNNIPSADKWWLLQINKDHHSSKTGSACRVYGFWLDEQQNHEESRIFSLIPDPVKLYFGSILKHEGTPLVIPVSEITTGWRNGKVSYAFTNEYCSRLDHLSDQHRLSLETPNSSSISDTEESEGENDSSCGENPVEHEVELVSIARRRVIRSSEGNMITSYKDFAGIRRHSRQPRRQLSQTEQNDDLIAAQRDNLEFE